MPASEIDDIFANKPQAKAVPPAHVAASVPSRKRKRGKKLSAVIQDTAPSSVEAKPSKKCSIPETVVDPSAQSVSIKRHKSDTSRRPNSSVVDSRREERLFRDSRGTAPRRKTDDGYSIYKEDELGISSAGGDTPLCPFDCNCCF
ncbi:DUF1764-domain-containing protein [Phlebopus sp. FC_14]|nr:DUF1764-domain-containing protein [Phlebopus sp. FC_14]